MTEKYLDLSVDEGKYRFVQDTADAPLRVLRHGEPWIENLELWNVAGGKAISAALFELEEARYEAARSSSVLASQV